MTTSRSSRSRRDDDLHIDDVVEEILLRLPVKEVLRCKLLSKPYYALIKNPNFIKRHLLYRSNSTNNIIAGMHLGVSSLGLPSLSSSHIYVPPLAMFPDGIENNLVIVAGSCHGLLFSNFVYYNNVIQLLWNPATREQKILPPLPDRTCKGMGFGYDVKSDDYKIVNVSAANRLDIWTTKTNSWRQIQSGSVLVNIIYCYGGVFVRENFYWLGFARDKSGYKMVLVSLGMGDDSPCSLSTLPREVTSAPSNDSLRILDLMGSLALSIRLPNDDKSDRCIYEIWVMDEDNKNSWAKQYSIGPFPQQVWLAGISVGGRFLMRSGTSPHSKLFLYDPCNKDQKELPSNFSITNSLMWPPRSYIESLVSLN